MVGRNREAKSGQLLGIKQELDASGLKTSFARGGEWRDKSGVQMPSASEWMMTDPTVGFGDCAGTMLNYDISNPQRICACQRLFQYCSIYLESRMFIQFESSMT